MQIRVKLMGMLRDKTPPNEALDLPLGATITDALVALEIPVDSVQVFTVNGSLVPDRQHELGDNDELTVLPPVGGG